MGLRFRGRCQMARSSDAWTLSEETCIVYLKKENDQQNSPQILPCFVRQFFFEFVQYTPLYYPPVFPFPLSADRWRRKNSPYAVSPLHTCKFIYFPTCSSQNHKTMVVTSYTACANWFSPHADCPRRFLRAGGWFECVGQFFSYLSLFLFSFRFWCFEVWKKKDIC